MADQIIFNDDLGILGAPGSTANLSGLIGIDYPTNLVTGSLTLASFNGLGPQVFSNLTLTQTGTTIAGIPIYNLSGSNGVTGISIDYTGVLPTTANINVADPLGAPLAGAVGAAVQANIVCFAAGTRFRTQRGDIAIEDLRIGEVVRTASGPWRPIVWTGSRRIDCRTHPEPRAVMPIRIAAEAFGAGRPSRDLFVSPGHGICVSILDEVLIPAWLLVNGTTVTQVEVDEITYWHVELETHDILLADGLPTESYIDVDNRTFFNDGRDRIDGPGNPDPSRTAATLSDYCRPYVTDDTLARAIRQRLRARSEVLGWTLDETPDAGLHLLADGEIIQPELDGLTARFDLPADAIDVWLMSETSIPARVRETWDGRTLGVCLRRLLVVAGEETRQVNVDDELLCIGFHPVEGAAETTCRWTTGQARLPAALWAASAERVVLQVEMAGPALPRWVAPKTGSRDNGPAPRFDRFEAAA